MRVAFSQAPSIDGWTLSYLAKNESEETLAVNSMTDAVQVFNSDSGNVQMLQEDRSPMPPDDLPPGSTYGSWIDINSLEDGTYQVYVMLDDDASDSGPTARLEITVQDGAVVNQQAS